MAEKVFVMLVIAMSMGIILVAYGRNHPFWRGWAIVTITGFGLVIAGLMDLIRSMNG